MNSRTSAADLMVDAAIPTMCAFALVQALIIEAKR